MANKREESTAGKSWTTGFNEITVEKRGLNPEVSKVKIRPAPPKPIATNEVTPTAPPSDDSR